MSEKQEKRRRYQARLQYIRDVEWWRAREPKKIFIFAWLHWKKQKPERSRYG